MQQSYWYERYNKSVLYTKHIKLFLDFLLSFFAIIMIFPLLGLISLCIVLNSKGPIIFKQRRVGESNKEFVIYKFRTMVVNAEHIGPGIMKSGENDARITKVGKILRKTSLDELPQLFNILFGSMSFIGPRPTVKKITMNFSEYQMERHQIKPGITGIAQVIGRQNLDWDEKIKFDLEYINRTSFLLDIRILFKTVGVVLFQKNTHVKNT